MSDVLELFTYPTHVDDTDWKAILSDQHCKYLGKRCDKRRKSRPDIAIGTCSVAYGVRDPRDVVICPHRFLERRQIFMDAVHLLTMHEPGNELHVLPEHQVPGGSVDYIIVSAKGDKVVDFAGIEIQALDTTGTAWPERQLFLQSQGVEIDTEFDAEKGYGMNWKMTAKTILVQMHHKVETFEHVGKRLVLVLQDVLLDYMERQFAFGHLEDARLGDSTHFHAYSLARQIDGCRLQLNTRKSTDAAGIAACLGLQVTPHVELATIIAALEERISEESLLTV